MVRSWNKVIDHRWELQFTAHYGKLLTLLQTYRQSAKS